MAEINLTLSDGQFSADYDVSALEGIISVDEVQEHVAQLSSIFGPIAKQEEMLEKKFLGGFAACCGANSMKDVVEFDEDILIDKGIDAANAYLEKAATDSVEFQLKKASKSDNHRKYTCLLREYRAAMS